jgi:phage terminase large subunit-like protein
MEACKDYEVQMIGCDPANAWQLIGNLQDDGVKIEKYAMSWSNISEPCKQVERMYAGLEINHGGNPVTRWMLQNVHIRKDANGNVRPDKGRSKESIDGVIAQIIATGLYLIHKPTIAYSPNSDVIWI